MSEKAIVRVPATTANLGPGYDCLGAALQLHNIVTVTRGRGGRPDPLARKAADTFFAAARMRPFSFRLEITGDVPRSRGLGSSVTVRLGILAGLNDLCGTPLSRQRLFELCAELEGHPDNAAPAAFGGFTVASPGGIARFAVSSRLRFVLLVPDFEVATPAARKALPLTIPHAHAAENVGQACRITAAFASGRFELLRGAFSDHLHQPYRQPLIPFLGEVISAGEKAGALGGFLSGSGSTICCVTEEKAVRGRSRSQLVAAAMLEAAPCDARAFVVSADNGGYKTRNSKLKT
jgi:homoserine kinase